MAPPGTPIYSDNSQTDYYEDQNHIQSPEDLIYQARRRFFNEALERVGFWNLGSERWHYDFGNQNWAARSGNPFANYGLVD